MAQTGIAEIKKIYKNIKNDIENQISRFSKIWAEGKNINIFIEMAFCILTPQSKARSGWRAIENLIKKDLLLNGEFDDINKELNIVRFKNRKSEYLISAREKFVNNHNSTIKSSLIEFESIFQKREWLIKEVKGYGYKEASHFLRNIGLGKDIAILDRHILKNLLWYEIINEIPGSVTGKKYLEIEERMREFAEKIKIPLHHLDFVFWFKETGEVFK